MTAVKNLLNMTSLLCMIVILFCFIGLHLGYDGLILVGSLSLPAWFYVICQWSLIFLQFTLMACVIVDKYTHHVLKYSAVMFAIYFVSSIIFMIIPTNNYALAFLPTGVLPFVYLFFRAIKHKNTIETWKRFIPLYSAIGVYQLLTLVIKTGDFILGYNVLTQYQWLICSIDLTIVIAILFARGGVRHHGLLGLGLVRWECVILPEKIDVAREDRQDRAAVEAFKKLVGFQRGLAISLLLGVQVVQWVVILLVCAVGNVLIEGLVISSSFIAHGFIVKRRWHSKSVIVCTLSGAALFYASAKAIPAFGYTQLLPVIVGLFLIYAMYRVAVYTDNANMNADFIKSISTFKLERGCDAKEFERIADLRGLTKKQKALLRAYYCDELTWAAMEVKFSSWSLSSIKKYLKLAAERFLSCPETHEKELEV